MSFVLVLDADVGWRSYVNRKDSPAIDSLCAQFASKCLLARGFADTPRMACANRHDAKRADSSSHRFIAAVRAQICFDPAA
jgi:hypothetical protein